MPVSSSRSAWSDAASSSPSRRTSTWASLGVMVTVCPEIMVGATPAARLVIPNRRPQAAVNGLRAVRGQPTRLVGDEQLAVAEHRLGEDLAGGRDRAQG